VRLVRWTAEAAGQFEAAVKFIQQDNQTAGRTLAQTILSRIDGLANTPGVGRPGEFNGTRELVEVLFIWHGAQDWR